jgi:hypothetical protein
MNADESTEHTNDNPAAEPRSSRRRLLRLAGAATVGAAGASALAGRAVAETGYATVGGSFAVTDSVSQVQTAARPGESAFVFATVGLAQGGNGSIYPSALAGWSRSNDNPHGVYGYTNQPEGYGVIGFNDSGATDEDGGGILGRGYIGVNGQSTVTGGVGVFGNAATGYGVAAQGGSGAILMVPSAVTPPPQRIGTFRRGTLEMDNGGSLWFCYETGMPGKWRKLAGNSTGGTFHPITPTRVYDSRLTPPDLAAPGLAGVLTTAAGPRNVSIKDRRNVETGVVTTTDIVPAGATAIAVNVTISATVGSGFLAINPGGTTVVSASTINWSAAGLTLANGVIATINPSTRGVTVVPGGSGGSSTHFVLDVTGYWL